MHGEHTVPKQNLAENPSRAPEEKKTNGPSLQRHEQTAVSNV